MKYFKYLLLTILASILIFSPVDAAQIEEPDNNTGNITIGADQEVKNTLIGAGNRIDIRGLVTRNAILAGANVSIENSVGGDVIAAAETVGIHNNIKGDVIAAGRSIEIDQNTNVGGDVIAFGAEVIINGRVSGNLKVYAGQVTINGSVFGNVDIGASSLTLGDQAMVGGNIKGQLENPINRSGSAQVNGLITLTDNPMNNSSRFDGSLATAIGLAGFSIFTKIYVLLSTLILGLVIHLLMPKFLEKVRKESQDNPINLLIIGLVTTILALPVILGLLVFVVTIPVAIVLGLGLSITWLIGSVFGYLWVGDLVSSKKWSPMMALLAGAAIVIVLKLVPFLGAMVGLLVGLIGFGAVLSFIYRIANRDLR